MKKTMNPFFLFLIIFSLFLSGCDFISININTSNNDSIPTISDFAFVTDDKLTYDEEENYYSLDLYENEKYQIKTTIDDSLGDYYYLKYTSNAKEDAEFTLTEDGRIETAASLSKNSIFSIYAELYKNGSTRRILRKYIIFSLMEGEYANITLINDNLEYDSNTSTYSMSMNSGTSFTILYSVSYNVSYILSFSLKDSSYSSFMNVDDKGNITTIKTNEDKVGEIIIKLTGANGILDLVYLKVNLKKSEDFKDELKVYDKTTAKEINNGDTLTIYKGQEMSFDISFNGEEKTNVMEIGDSTILEVDNTSNKIRAIKVGTSVVTFKYETKSIVVTINVINDKLLSIESPNKGSDFVIINDVIHYLNNMVAVYESGIHKEINDNSSIKTTIVDKNEEYKTVTFTYVDEEVVSVTYDVKYFSVLDYVGRSTAYDNDDYHNNIRYGTIKPLSNEGTIKMLVIPVWFKDSNVFFDASQKDQIIEDIEYTMKGNRPSDELKAVKQYYEAQSYGAITMDITISEFYESSTSYEDYSDNISYKQINTNILATDAISWYFDKHSNEKFEDYDSNNDGFVDGLILYYGANYYGAANDENRSTAFEKDNNGNEDYSYNVLSFCPIGGLYGLGRQNITSQKEIKDLSLTYSTAFRSSARTVIHEIGHMFGNVDLYESQLADERYSPAGGFVMQEDNYGSHDPYHVNRIGWSKPQVYASNDYKEGDKITIHIKDFQSSGQNIILTNTWNSSDSLYDEYLILELFAPSGLNEFDSKVIWRDNIESGVRLWHVNSLLSNYNENNELTSEIIDGNKYELANSNYDVDSKYDVLHMIRNNVNEPYNTNSKIQTGANLFKEGDSFDMETYKSQFVNEGKLDNGEKLGWSFKVESIYSDTSESYGAVITLERTDNVRTDFAKTVSLNRDDLNEPVDEEDYSEQIFGEDSEFTFIYKYVTPPSVYEQGFPISSKGMCLFASSDGNGGYIDLIIKEIQGKEVCINSIAITYSNLTNVTPTVIVNEESVEGIKFTPSIEKAYGYEYVINSNAVRIQNRYDGTINHWSVLPLLELTINYTIK